MKIKKGTKLICLERRPYLTAGRTYILIEDFDARYENLCLIKDDSGQVNGYYLSRFKPVGFTKTIHPEWF